MERDEDIQMEETTSDFLTEMLTDEKDGQAFTEAFLKSGFLSSAVDALFYARRQAGLTQAEIAERLKTKQAAIARLEADTAGSMSLRRYVEVAMACGMVPLDIKLVPASSIRNYVIDHPEAPRTQDLYDAWLRNRLEPAQASQAIPAQPYTAQSAMNSPSQTNITLSNKEGMVTSQSAERYLKEQCLRQANQTLPQWSAEGTTNMISASQVPTLAQTTA